MRLAGETVKWAASEKPPWMTRVVGCDWTARPATVAQGLDLNDARHGATCERHDSLAVLVRADGRGRSRTQELATAWALQDRHGDVDRVAGVDRPAVGVVRR